MWYDVIVTSYFGTACVRWRNTIFLLLKREICVQGQTQYRKFQMCLSVVGDITTRGMDPSYAGILVTASISNFRS